MARSLRKAYSTIVEDHFPARMELCFGEGSERRTLVYEKVTWPDPDGRPKGLRYGENPDQEAAMYRLVDGAAPIDGVPMVAPGQGLVTDARLLRSGKHPGKINMTDIDAALLVLRYLTERPACAIIKHNNPCGVAQGASIEEAFTRALEADMVAAFGGAVVLGRPCDRSTAEAIGRGFVEVVAAPSYEPGAVEILEQRKSLRVVEVPGMARLAEFRDLRFVELKSLMDGGLVVQTSFVARPRTGRDLALAEARRGSETVRIARPPTDAEIDDLLFGWYVEAGVTSNSVLYVRDGATVAIGTGEQDRVGVARIARDKAYRNAAERVARTEHGKPLDELDREAREAVEARVRESNGGLKGARMVSDAFFPFPDGLRVGLTEGVTAVVQPGGSLNDAAAIDACNEVGATMVFTGQRSFKH